MGSAALAQMHNRQTMPDATTQTRSLQHNVSAEIFCCLAIAVTDDGLEGYEQKKIAGEIDAIRLMDRANE